jgi:hypothetical protein
MTARERARSTRSCVSRANVRASVLTINLVGCTPVLCERIRASLRRSPFLFSATEDPLPEADVDLYVAPAGRAQEICRRGAPTIAWGPAALLRSALLFGCVDYLKEPWTPEELGLRAGAALAREQQGFDFPWGRVCLHGMSLQTPAGPVALTFHESRILQKLLSARGEPVPREALSYSVSGTAGSSESRAVDVHVAALRRKVRRAVPEAGPFIVCVRRQGYLVP